VVEYWDGGEMKRTLLWYFWPFARELYAQLESDQERWGDEWKRRPVEAAPLDEEGVGKAHWAHQNDRIYNRIHDYYEEWYDHKTPIPWLKVAGLALIGWVREHYPGYANQ
jgi:hypothetical protein